MTADVEAPHRVVAARIDDTQLGGLLLHLQAGGPVTGACALDLALDLQAARTELRHQASVRAALAETLRALSAARQKTQGAPPPVSTTTDQPAQDAPAVVLPVHEALSAVEEADAAATAAAARLKDARAVLLASMQAARTKSHTSDDTGTGAAIVTPGPRVVVGNPTEFQVWARDVHDPPVVLEPTWVGRFLGGAVEAVDVEGETVVFEKRTGDPVPGLRVAPGGAPYLRVAPARKP